MFVSGINNYIKFKSKKNELVDYIKENDHLSKDALLTYFMKYKNTLGLSNNIYSRLIDKVRSNK